MSVQEGASSVSKAQAELAMLDNPWISKKPERKEAGFMVWAPYVYAPLLPIIRISLAKQPVLRDRLFFGTLGLAFVHGVYFCKSWGYEKEQ